MKRPTKKPAAVPELRREVFSAEEYPQGEEAWRQLRVGVPTASHFADVLVKSDERKTRTTYLYNLAGEILSGLPAEDFQNEDMRRGKAMEGHARTTYAFTNRCEVTQVGFVRRGRLGASPDGIIGDWHGAVEFKSVAPKLLIPRALKRDRSPMLEHLPQCKGVILVCELEYCDLYPYWPGFPETTFRVRREEPEMRWLQAELDRFCDELDLLVYRLRGDTEKLDRLKMEMPR